MTWNHRIIKHNLSRPAYLAVHEVFYDESGKVISWTLDPIDISGDSKQEILSLLKQITLDINNSTILSETRLEKIYKNDIELVVTCQSHPEQYDAFKDGTLVGYLRLRHGIFTVKFPDVGGKTIFSAFPKGDGMFEDDEREFYLNEARKAIEKNLSKKGHQA